MRIAFIISSLGSGGAERVVSIMANYWASKVWEILIFTLDDGSVPPFYTLDSRIIRIPLRVAKHTPHFLAGINRNIQQLFKIRNEIKRNKPKIIISFIDVMNIMTLLATRRLKLPVIISERTDPYKYRLAIIWERLRLLTYPMAQFLVVQTESAKIFFVPIMGSSIRVIPNPVLKPLYSDQGLDFRHPGKKVILAIGRFTYEKGFDLLIRAFARVKNNFSDWNLYIAGNGPLEEDYKNIIRQYQLEDRVIILGSVKNPYDCLRHADLFILPSRFEGFPNVLCEAMACSVAVIASSCSPGILDIIQDGENGVLFTSENENELAIKMDQLMSDEIKRQSLGRQAVKIVDRFDINKIMGLWEQILFELIEKYG